MLVVLIADCMLSNLEPRDDICEMSQLKDVKALGMEVAMFMTVCAVVSVGTEG
jgi:hypothetical protein